MSTVTGLSPEHRTGPTIPELLAQARALQHAVEPMFSWTALRRIITQGDLHLLRRNPAVEEIYMKKFRPLIQQTYGDIESYLISRFGWLNAPVPDHPGKGALPYWTSDQTASVRKNDWSYGVPHDVTHWVVWTSRPIFHPSLCSDADNDSNEKRSNLLPTPPGTPDRPNSPFGMRAEVATVDLEPGTWQSVQARGLTGETGFDDPIARVDFENAAQPQREIEAFVRKQWPENDWETLWFANPPHLRSVASLPHFHCLARHKFAE